MIDSVDIARQLTGAGIERNHADAVASAIVQAAEQAAEQAEYVTRADLRAELLALELRLIKWIVGTVLAGAGVVIAALRLLP